MVVDDHPMVRKGLSMFISGFSDLQLVGEAANAAAALELYRRERPDVVLMDLVMPEEDGASIIHRIRQEFPQAAMIALTSFGEEHLIQAALRAGARGFLYKTVSVDELAQTIRQVHQGRAILDPKASDVMLRMISSSTWHQAPELDELSERENQVLQLLVEGLTNKQIAAQLQLRPSTVKQYISNILAKLHAQSRTEAVAAALKMGLITK
ncbi:MAG: DNA-binding response regulator [Anaerolineae bacterium]|nr:MAG: DNA-binding response regulator [Anaerolineae bacterium]